MSLSKHVFKDSKLAALYAKYRPIYPSTVYDKILEFFETRSEFTGEKVNNGHKLAVDVGCGSGQGTFPLCQHFKSVIGMDISEAQIEEARLKVDQGQVQGQGNVTFRVGDAEDLSFLEDNSVDLITAAIVIHWLDVEKFCMECRRVLRPGGVLAAYSFGKGSYFGTDGQPLNDMEETVKVLAEMESIRPKLQLMYNKYEPLVPVFQKIFSQTERVDSIPYVTKHSMEDYQGRMETFRMNTRELSPDKPTPDDAEKDSLLQVYNNNPRQDAVTGKNEFFIIMGKK